MARRKLHGIQFDSPDEREVFHARESWVPLVIGAIPFVVLGIAALVIAWSVFQSARVGWILLGVAILAAAITRMPRIIANLDTDVIVTNKRLYCRTGIIDIKDQVSDLSSISDVTVDPSIFGRLFDYADVRIQTFAGEEDFLLRGIAHAYDMRAAISQGADANKGSQPAAPRPRQSRR